MTQPSGRRPQVLKGVMLLLASAMVGPASAMDFSLSGFGTLGAARSTDESAQFVRDLSHPDGLTEQWSLNTDSVLGLQADLNIRPEWSAALQAVSHYRPDGGYEPEITWAFLGFDPNPSWSLRAGRLGIEFYMLADSRLVGYSYLTVRPPIDYYGTLPFSYVDGMDVSATRPLAGGLFRAKLFGGVSREQTPWDQWQFNMSGSLLVGGYLDYQKGPWQVRLGQSSVRFANDLPIEDFYAALPEATADELRVKDHWSHFSSLGIVYDAGPLQTQLMLSKTFNEHGTFEDTWSGYLVLGYRVQDWTPFVGVSAAKSAPANLQYAIPGYTDTYQANFHTDQRTYFLGTRWDFRPGMALKAQVDVIRGDPSSTFLYRWENEEWDGSMTVFSLSWNFVF
ncbi:hypothetical protein [Thiocystis violacea]|uniref:hypothetical protein n=1 Tax=Thiocystis violacea TaxID=13725 RepID=UPI001903E3AF|nr:hypothetical protein [Thiocystis violacea]